jgi:probable O-glycosylation ligase (exosortase A-associated)
VKYGFGFLFLITIPAVFFTYSRGALVGLVAVTTLMFLQLRQRWVLIPVVAIGVVVAMMFAPAGWKHRMDPTRPDAIDNSAKERLNAWAFSWNLASEYPLAGGGFATFTPELFAVYAPVAMDIHGPHSVYFGVLAEHGFTGLALYLTLVGSCLVGATRLIGQAKRRGDKTVLSYANMIRFSMVAFLTCGTFLGRAYFDYFYSLVAALTVLECIAVRAWEESDDEEHAEDAEPDGAEHLEVAGLVLPDSTEARAFA